MIMVFIFDPPDCANNYLFDVATKQLFAVLHSCNGLGLGVCGASRGCLPARCMVGEPIFPEWVFNEAACPVLADAGPPLPDTGLADGAASGD